MIWLIDLVCCVCGIGLCSVGWLGGFHGSCWLVWRVVILISFLRCVYLFMCWLLGYDCVTMVWFGCLGDGFGCLV